jgi:Protein-L-isoaspartate(D-aspartate) O-methyltransferase (PCMT)
VEGCAGRHPPVPRHRPLEGPGWPPRPAGTERDLDIRAIHEDRRGQLVTRHRVRAEVIKIAQVPRKTFIPEIIWVDIGAAHSQSGFNALSKNDHLQRWQELVWGNEPVITQVDEGHIAAGETGWSPSSSGSKPSIVAGMLDALWNAALLCRRVGTRGRVVSVEVDPVSPTMREQRCCHRILTACDHWRRGRRVLGGAPYDRIVATASVREAVPKAWLAQTRSGGLIVTPWGTDYCNGVMPTLRVIADHSPRSSAP